MGSRRYCRNCGFRIMKGQVRTGREFFGPFWREAWVHYRNGEEACLWRAEPKTRGSRTLHEQILDARAPIHSERSTDA